MMQQHTQAVHGGGHQNGSSAVATGSPHLSKQQQKKQQASANQGHDGSDTNTNASSLVRFLVSSEITSQVEIRVDRLKGNFFGSSEGEEGAASPSSSHSHASNAHDVLLCQYKAEVALYYNGHVLCRPVSTRYVGATCGGTEVVWDQTLSLCVKYRDLPLDTILVINVWPSNNTTLVGGGGGSQEKMASEPTGGCTLRLFSKKLRLRSGTRKLRLWKGVVAGGDDPTKTPGKIPVNERGKTGMLERQLKHYNRGDMPEVEHLDKLCIAKIYDQLAKEEESMCRDKGLYLVQIELSHFPLPVLFQEQTVVGAGGIGMANPNLLSQGSLNSQDSRSLETLHDILQAGHTLGQRVIDSHAQLQGGGHQVIYVSDPEIGRENPAERKAQRMARSEGPSTLGADRNLKPNSSEKREIESVLRQPLTQALSREAKKQLWRFRYSMLDNPMALVKFLLAVDWLVADEVQEALGLMHQWASVSTTDVLCLLSSNFANPGVRGHAVSVLKTAEDEEIVSYLLQLVQALRYEHSIEDSPLATFLIKRACQNHVLGNFLHWYLFVEWQDPVFGAQYAQIYDRFVNVLLSEPSGYALWDDIRRQMELVAQLTAVKREMESLRTAARKKERLHELLSESGLCGELASLRLPLPLDPNVLLTGVIPEESSVFKSALTPILLTFKTAVTVNGHSLPESKYSIIFKKGDDLRQDQLVVQMIQLMDILLKKDGLDLKLNPYKVLATAAGRDAADYSGFVECVPNCRPISNVLAEYSDIRRFLAEHHPDPKNPQNASKEVLKNFIKSCAGSCVVTYILGVGDRHLDNLMLTEDGRLFHIDFGYILGKDPKPFPPPMKLCKEMVEAMGGSNSDSYRQFYSYCCEAYNILRKSANLILNLFQLMEGARIPDISNDPQKAMLKLQDKFRLDLNDEEAGQWMQKLINDSASALMPQLLETAHRWATYWR
jgi:phosphatidylinositol 3-kinase